MSTPAKRIIKVDRKAPSNTPKLHTDTRGDWVFDKEVSKIRRAGYEERMNLVNPEPPKRKRPLPPWKQALLGVDENGRKWYPGQPI